MCKMTGHVYLVDGGVQNDHAQPGPLKVNTACWEGSRRKRCPSAPDYKHTTNLGWWLFLCGYCAAAIPRRAMMGRPAACGACGGGLELDYHVAFSCGEAVRMRIGQPDHAGLLYGRYHLESSPAPT